MGPKTFVILFNMGGPGSLDEVTPFLAQLFHDPDILDIPLGWLWRHWLARKIVRSRAATAREIYAHIGGKSPLLEITQAQGQALQEALAQTRPPLAIEVRIAMRYTQPGLQEAMAGMGQEDRVICVPLYPHYSKTTTGSFYHELERLRAARRIPAAQFIRVSDYHDHPAYIRSWVNAINQVVATIPTHIQPQVPILFSAHGVPCRLIAQGDPYQRQIERSIALISQQGGWHCPILLSYQSKVGKAKWLGPATQAALTKLGQEGRPGVVVVPISFVAENSETLYEQDMLLKNIAQAAGLRDYWRVPCPNADPLFIQCLQEIVGKSR